MTRTLSLTLINTSGEQRPLFTFENPVTYLTLLFYRITNDQSELGKGSTAMLRKLKAFFNHRYRFMHRSFYWAH